MNIEYSDTNVTYDIGLAKVQMNSNISKFRATTTLTVFTVNTITSLQFKHFLIAIADNAITKKKKKKSNTLHFHNL